MITVDYHTHNFRCGHAQGQIEDYVKAAISRGLLDIGISDHSPLYFLDGNDPHPGLAMAKDELDGYVEEVLQLKAKYAGQINVRLGIESDYIEGMEDDYRAIFARYPFDYIIGSVHYILGANVYDARRWHNTPDPLPTYAEYYRLVQKSAHCGLFDILAHTTAIVAYSPRPIPVEIEPLQDAALEAIRESGLCMEVNSSGYRKMRTDPFPSVRMIGKAVELGIPLTFSSDAHNPGEVAYAREQIEAIFVAKEVPALARFENRQRSLIPFVVEPTFV